MAYVVVLEGQHKSGKSTLAAQLERIATTSGDWTSVVSIHHTRGDSTPEKLVEDRKMVADAPDDTLYIFDRHYLSELVYAPVDGRGTTLPYNPLYWEQYMGKWIDQRGVRLYLMGEPLHINEHPVIQMYERLTARTGWMRVEPREFLGDALAKDVLAALSNKRLQNDTWGFPCQPEVTATHKLSPDNNYLQSVEAAAGLERSLHELLYADGDPAELREIARVHYQELLRVRAELDEMLMKPFETEGELSLWTPD